MTVFGQLTSGMSESERLVAFLGVAFVFCCGIWAFLRWLLQGPKTPDPWGGEVAADIESETAAPLCPHCLAPHGELAHACPECGAPVGAYTSLMPPLYLYSIGHIFRMGTSGTFKRSPFLMCGYYFVSLAGYAFLSPLALLAPVYWVMLSKNIARLRGSNRPEIEMHNDSSS